MTYREFNFKADQATLQSDDSDTVSGVAAYLRQNPSLQLGIDSSINASSANQQKLALAARRGNAVRDSLIAAGVPANKISQGEFGSTNMRRDDRVALLIKTDPNPQTQQAYPTRSSTVASTQTQQAPQTRTDSPVSSAAVEQWKSYREFSFEADPAAISQADSEKSAQIAAYMKQNPSLQLGIDSSINGIGVDQDKRDLAKRRSDAVRESLIAAGVPADKISQIDLGTASQRHNDHVAILVRSDSSASAQTGSVASAEAGEKWTSYGEFWFDTDATTIRDTDTQKVARIAAYMKQNPSLHLGLDGSRNPRATDQRHVELCDQRVKAVREALIAAGVPADRVSEGMFGKLELRRDNRVEVFTRFGQIAREQ